MMMMVPLHYNKDDIRTEYDRSPSILILLLSTGCMLVTLVDIVLLLLLLLSRDQSARVIAFVFFFRNYN